MILSGLSHVREYLENLEKSGNSKVKIMWQPSLCIIKHCIEFVLFLNFFELNFEFFFIVFELC